MTVKVEVRAVAHDAHLQDRLLASREFDTSSEMRAWLTPDWIETLRRCARQHDDLGRLRIEVSL
jgi:hypothetical protein